MMRPGINQNNHKKRVFVHTPHPCSSLFLGVYKWLSALAKRKANELCKDNPPTLVVFIYIYLHQCAAEGALAPRNAPSLLLLTSPFCTPHLPPTLDQHTYIFASEKWLHDLCMDELLFLSNDKKSKKER
jgi:hypothetical protein